MALFPQQRFAREFRRIDQRLRKLERVRSSRGLSVTSTSDSLQINTRPDRQITFFGNVRDAGPGGESDYFDSRYWVREILIKRPDDFVPAPSDLQIKLAEYEELALDTDNRRWVTATNIAEVILPEGATPETKHRYVPRGTTVEVRSIQPPGTKYRRWYFYHPFRSARPVFLQISAAMEIPGVNRWMYVGVEQELASDGSVWQDKPGGMVVTPVLNTVENYNDNSGIEGHSVDIDGVDYPAGFSVQPIQGEPVLPAWQELRSGSGPLPGAVWWVSYENADDGTCT